MRARPIATLIILLLCGCAASGVDVTSLLQQYDDYEKDVRAVASDPRAIEVLDGAQAKRTEAAALIEKGKKSEAATLLEEATADARLAYEVDRAQATARRAEKCRLEVEQARTKWSEAVFVLEQTEEFVQKDAPAAKIEPVTAPAVAALPSSTLQPDSFPPPDLSGISTEWTAWRKAASDYKVASADLERIYTASSAAAQMEKVEPPMALHQRYLAARATQSLECRVRAEANENVCLESTEQIAAYADGREAALRATLEL